MQIALGGREGQAVPGGSGAPDDREGGDPRTEESWVRPSQAEGELRGEKPFRRTAGMLGHQISKACF